MQKLNSITCSLISLGLLSTTLALTSTSKASAATFNITPTRSTADVPATAGGNGGTGIDYVDLSALVGAGQQITSIKIVDDATQDGGSPGKYSGYDLDAIKISSTNLNVNDATQLASLNDAGFGLNVFNFNTGGYIFNPGTIRPSTDPNLQGALFGSPQTSTLNTFDADESVEPRTGEFSLGEGGSIEFLLTQALSTNTPLYLYAGEGGNNSLASSIVVTTQATAVPEASSTLGLLAFGVVGAGSLLKRKQQLKA
jgi:hypothetical protein